jgi:hypothetical protein
MLAALVFEEALKSAAKLGAWDFLCAARSRTRSHQLPYRCDPAFGVDAVKRD